MIYGYARCSTNATLQDITRQEKELTEAGAELIFKEYEHGDSITKKQQEKLFDSVKAGDTIIVTEVSRLSRSTMQLCRIIEQVKEKCLRLVIINSIQIDCRNGELDPMTNAFLQMSGVFAELEKKMIQARVISGVANARAKGKQIGRRATTEQDIPDIFFRYLPKYKSGDITKVEFSKLAGLSRPSIDKYLKIIAM